MNTYLPKNIRSMNDAWGQASRNLQALDLCTGKADISRILSFNQMQSGTSLSKQELHLALIEKTLPLLNPSIPRNTQKISLDTIDPAHPKSCTLIKSSNLAVACLFEKQTTQKRIFLLLPDPSIQDNTIHSFIVGNVDLFLANPNQLLKDKKEIKITKSDTFSKITPSMWLEVAQHLDGGQRLNLGQIYADHPEFFKEFGVSNPYEQHYHQMQRYITRCPNGPLNLKPMPSRFFVVHQSAYKKEILSSSELRVSRGGCIGNLVYTTELVGKEGQDLGGHAIGLLQRKSIDPADYQSNLILLKVNKTGNVFSNWIDKFGRGSLIYSARRQLFSKNISKEFLKADQTAQKLALEAYKQFFPFLQLSLLLMQVTRHHQDLPDLHAQKLFTVFKRLHQNSQAVKNFAILNSIYFEIVKDYILLFQNDPTSKMFRMKESFNMGLQYQIFFELCPQLKKDWDTTQFNPSIKKLEEVLSHHGFLDAQNNPRDFQKFFLQRLAYYSNISLLEGKEKLPKPDLLQQFDHIHRLAPNLASILYYYSLKSRFKKASVFQKFSDGMREEYFRFYQERNIDVVVKCGLGRTEEVGLNRTCQAVCYDFDIEHHSLHDIQLNPKESVPSLKIQGVSQTNGFTYRPPGANQ